MFRQLAVRRHTPFVAVRSKQVLSASAQESESAFAKASQKYERRAFKTATERQQQTLGAQRLDCALGVIPLFGPSMGTGKERDQRSTVSIQAKDAIDPKQTLGVGGHA